MITVLATNENYNVYSYFILNEKLLRLFYCILQLNRCNVYAYYGFSVRMKRRTVFHLVFNLSVVILYIFFFFLHRSLTELSAIISSKKMGLPKNSMHVFIYLYIVYTHVNNVWHSQRFWISKACCIFTV